jgi:hypothetical protein
LQSCVLRRIAPHHALPNQHRSPQHHPDQRLPSLCRSPLYRLDRDLRPNLSRFPLQRIHPFHPKRITILTTSRPSSRAQLRWRERRCAPLNCPLATGHELQPRWLVRCGLRDCARAVLFKSSATRRKPRSLRGTPSRVWSSCGTKIASAYRNCVSGLDGK